MVAIGGYIAVGSLRDFVWRCVRQMIPNRDALAAQIPATFDLVRRGAHTENKIRRKFPVRFGRSVEKVKTL